MNKWKKTKKVEFMWGRQRGAGHTETNKGVTEWHVDRGPKRIPDRWRLAPGAKRKYFWNGATGVIPYAGSGFVIGGVFLYIGDIIAGMFFIGVVIFIMLFSGAVMMGNYYVSEKASSYLELIFYSTILLFVAAAPSIYIAWYIFNDVFTNDHRGMTAFFETLYRVLQ